MKVFKENEDIQILNGRWGAYIKAGKDNVKIPKGTEWESLTLADCERLHKEQPATKKGGRFAKKSTAKKK